MTKTMTIVFVDVRRVIRRLIRLTKRHMFKFFVFFVFFIKNNNILFFIVLRIERFVNNGNGESDS